MSEHELDQAFGRALQQTGALTPEQISHAASVQAKQVAQGTPCSLADVLLEQGLITPSMRTDLEKKLRAQQVGTSQLGPYRLVRRLGQGAMGAVYLAEDTLLARQVALKVLPKTKSENREFVARFKREATAAGKLNHVNIAGAYAVDEDQGFHYYAMEFCDGEPLNEALKKSGHLPQSKVLELGIQIARGLQFAHERGIIHRDVKPENAILTKDGVVKVLDLGLSKDMASNEGFQTMSGIAMGTPHYISPEQASGKQDVDGRTDIYSLGATLYHLATGTTPYSGPTAAVIMTKHLTERLPDPRDINPDLSDGMVHILTRAMAKAPEDRYQNMGEFLTDMELVRDGQEPASERVESARSSIAAHSGRLGRKERRTTGPNDPVLVGSRGAPRTQRTTGPQDPVRGTGRNEPIEGRPTTGVRNVIHGRAPSGRPDGPTTRPWSNRQKFLMGAGAGVVLVLLMGLVMVLRGKGDQRTADGEPKEVPTTTPGRSIPDPQKPVLPPVIPGPATPTVPPVPPVTTATAASAPPTEQTDYDPKAMVAQVRLAEMQAFAAKYPDDPWSYAEMLKDFISKSGGMKAADDAQAILKKLTFEGERPAAHRNWQLEWENVSAADSPLGSLSIQLDSRRWVLSTYPPAQNTPLVFQRKLLVPTAKPILVFQARAHESGDFDLQVQVDGKSTARQMVGGKTWRTFSLDLTEFAGREALVRVLHIPTGWNNEQGYWQAPNFVGKEPQGAWAMGWAGEILLDGTKPVFLSNLEATDVKVGYGQFGRTGYLGFDAHRIMVNGVPSPNGLGTHAVGNGEAHVTYLLGKRFSGLRAKVALNDSAGEKGCDSPLTFVVNGDGRTLWTSQPISRTKEPQSVEVGLEGVEKLELLVRCQGKYDHGHAVWIEPQLLPGVLARSGIGDTPSKPVPVPAPAQGSWASLFDGKTLDGWRTATGGDFANTSKIHVENEQILLEVSQGRTGIVWTKDFPTVDYEVEFEAKRLTGNGDFASTTFPVGPDPCALIVAGWGNVTTGLGCIDGALPSNNMTTRKMSAENGRWYRVRVRVTAERVEAFIDDARVADVPRRGHRFSLTEMPNLAHLKPFGISAFGSLSALRNIRVRRLNTPAGEEPAVAKPLDPATTSEPAQATGLKTVPKPELLKEAEKTIKDLFRAEYAKSAPADRLALAGTLLRQGLEERNDLASKYTLCREAAAQAALAGNADLIVRAMDELKDTFSIAFAEEKLAALSRAESAVRTPEAAVALSQAFLHLIEEAFATDEYSVALKASDRIASLARLAQDPALVETAKERGTETRRLMAEFDKVRPAAEKLPKSPDDPAANLAVGKFRCAAKGDWEQGLPLLLKAKDPDFAPLAAKELANPTDLAAQLALAEGWWALAERQFEVQRNGLRARAAHWYEAALPTLTGVDKLRAEQRLAELARTAPRSATIDLLTLIDPARDAVNGKWTRSGTELTSDHTGAAKIEIPYRPPEEYDLTVTFTRKEGGNDMYVILCGGGRQFGLMLGGFGNSATGLEMVRGKRADENETTVKRSPFIQNGHKYILEIKVRRGNVAAWLDREPKPLFQLKTDYRDLSMKSGFEMRAKDVLGLATWSSPTTIHSVRITEITGRGQRTR